MQETLVNTAKAAFGHPLTEVVLQVFVLIKEAQAASRLFDPARITVCGLVFLRRRLVKH